MADRGTTARRRAPRVGGIGGRAVPRRRFDNPGVGAQRRPAAPTPAQPPPVSQPGRQGPQIAPRRPPQQMAAGGQGPQPVPQPQPAPQPQVGIQQPGGRDLFSFPGSESGQGFNASNIPSNIPGVDTSQFPDPNAQFGGAIPGGQQFLGNLFGQQQQQNPFGNFGGAFSGGGGGFAGGERGGVTGGATINRGAPLAGLGGGGGGIGGTGGGQPGQQNPFLGIGQDLLGQGINLPGSPQFQQAQIDRGALGFGGPQVGQFDPNAVGGPNVQQVGQIDRGGFGGPGTGINQALDIAREFGGGQQGPIAREQLMQQQFGQSGLGQEAFQGALAANQRLANAPGVQAADLSGTRQTILGEAGRIGANLAGSRGFGTGGIVGGGEIGRQLGLTAARLTGEEQNRILQSQQMQDQRQLGAAGQLGALGGQASSALQGTQGLRLGQQQGLNVGNIQQRGQDIQQQQFGQGQAGQRLGDIASLIGATSGAEQGAFGAGTTRGLGIGGQNLQRDIANQQAGLQGFGLGTQRQGVQGDIFGQGQQNQIGAFQAGTQRGLGAGELDLGFNQLGSQNLNQFQQNQLGLFGEQGRQQIGAFGAQAGAAQGLAGAANQQQQIGNQFALGQGSLFNQFQGNQQAFQQNIGGIAQDILQGGAQGTQFMNDLRLQAAQGNQQAVSQLQQLQAQLETSKQIAGSQRASQEGMQRTGLVSDALGAAAAFVNPFG